MRTPCCICDKPAEASMTWQTTTAPQGGPMCAPCMEITSAALDRFPTARDTITIWPLAAGVAA
ncbi:MAG: hypothetical protein A2341_14940 [Deltaproteobacteria bacterium RIFOXYB12_FULL_58_9]|nr:MAG: hypothetical protein A2341_14940 [Deltaproteobacteria bacterium RIFOXYB12_FULL_58_9]